jgi:hypothetical protein
MEIGIERDAHARFSTSPLQDVCVAGTAHADF